jgi:hypothetical protein
MEVLTGKRGEDMMKPYRVIHFIIMTAVILCVTLPLSLFSIEDEYYRKAALLKAFSQYIEWPENSGVKDKNQPFVIGIIGKNPFGSILEKAYSQSSYKIKDRKVEIRAISKPEEIGNCHILFISGSEEKQLDRILAITTGKPILTVGETKGFAEKGAIFNLYISGNDIRFEIDADALQKSRLIVDSQLLSFGTIVKLPGEGKK